MIDSHNVRIRKDVLGYSVIGAIVGISTLSQVKVNDPTDVFIFLACAILASIGAQVAAGDMSLPAGLLITLVGIERLNTSNLLFVALAVTILCEAQNTRRALNVMSTLFELTSVTIGIVAAQATDMLLAPLWSNPFFPARLIASSLVLMFNFGLANSLTQGVARPCACLYQRECRPLLPWFITAAYLAYLVQCASLFTGYHAAVIALPLMLVINCGYRAYVQAKTEQKRELSASYQNTIKTLSLAIDTRDNTANSPALSLREAMHMMKAGAGKSFDPNIGSLLERRISELEGEADPTARVDMINDNGIAARSQDICQLGNQLRAESDAAAIAEPIASGRQETLLLQNLAKDLGQSECIEGAISAVHQHLSRIVTYDTLAVYVRHHENLEPIRIIGQHEHLFSREGFPIEKGLSGWVAEHRSPILNGAASDECCYTDDPDLINRLQAVVAVPLEGSSGFTGVLALYHSKQNAFGQDDLRILQAVSTSLGRATESALRFKKVEESAVADHLTEIPNARALAVHLKDEIDGTSLEQSTVGAPLRDLNGFKQVNDRFGHSKGDGVLRNVARGLRSDTGPQSRSRGAGDNQPAMYKVTIQSTPAKQIVWKVAASGRWTPGQPPQLAKHLLSAEVLNELFNVTPSETDQSGRNQIQCGDTLYGVVFRRIPKWERQ